MFYGYHVTTELNERTIRHGRFLGPRPKSRDDSDGSIDSFMDSTAKRLGIKHRRENCVFMYADKKIAKSFTHGIYNIVIPIKLKGDEAVRHQVWRHLAGSRYQRMIPKKIVRAYWNNYLPLEEYLRDPSELDSINREGIALLPKISSEKLRRHHEIVIEGGIYL